MSRNVGPPCSTPANPYSYIHIYIYIFMLFLMKSIILIVLCPFLAGQIPITDGKPFFAAKPSFCSAQLLRTCCFNETRRGLVGCSLVQSLRAFWPQLNPSWALADGCSWRTCVAISSVPFCTNTIMFLVVERLITPTCIRSWCKDCLCMLEYEFVFL